ncbi:MAG: ABC transporter permease [Candidatus Planktophila sp.]|jgi:simple sugar transport system permease protein|nr:ABC transporter permease [Candidatus Planktophila sp.]MBP7903353.1 ABC transporter permease [Candidatus Planktophila sp.]
MKKFLSKITLPALAFTMALFVSGLLVAFSDSKVLALKSSPLSMIAKAFSTAGNAYWALFRGSIFDPELAKASFIEGFYPLSETIVAASPLILTGLSVALAFKAGLFNIGAQGQFIAGAIGASYVGFHFELPIVIHTLAAIAAALVCAGLYGGFVGFLKARTGAHEVIVTIMLNYVAGYFLLWILSTTPFLRPGRQDPLAPEVQMSSRLPHLFGSELRANLGFFIALLAAGAVWWLLNRSTWGFKFRAVGANAAASKTAGISVGRSTTTVMFIAGALAGLGGAVQILGSEPALTAGVGGTFGFDAITVALLGRGTPIGTVFAALLFGALRAGGLTMQASTETPLDLILVIQALVVLFIAAPALIKAIFRLKNVDAGEALASKGWNG